MKILLLFLVLLCSCKNPRVSNQKTVQEQQSFVYGKKQSCVFRTINNDIVKYIFTLDVFGSDTLLLKSIFKIHPIIKVIKEHGTYDNNEYLNFIFETPNTFIKFFNNEEGFYIESAVIKGDEIKLYKNCSIGMLKIDFCKQLSIEETVCDTIVIVDEDQTLNLNFIFDKEQLKQLEIQASK